MQVPEIKMSRAEAHAKAAAYSRAVRRSKDPELAALEAGYAALADGRVLIDLGQALGAAGWDAKGNPRLAIARADRRQVTYDAGASVRGWSQPRLTFTASMRGHGHPSLWRSVPLSAMPKQDPAWSRWRRGEALVPIIPADIREAATKASRKPISSRTWFILFEAEWRPVPPVDPVLLEHIGGPLYAVLAHWNLTELERAIMAGRLG